MSGSDLYDPELRACVRSAYARLRHGLRAVGPSVRSHARAWMVERAGGARPDRYFLHPEAFPMLLLPWWAGLTARSRPDLAFHTDVVYSTLNGYYFVRMLDDLMDRDGSPVPAMLPMLTFFHTEFERAYASRFEHGHPFWATFSRVSYQSAEHASLDASLTRIDRRTFLRVSSRKVVGAKIPLAAVCLRSGRDDLLDAWSGFVDDFGRWHQMWNDANGWARDLACGRPSYLLTEAADRVGAEGSVGRWLAREGLSWATSELDRWMDASMSRARRLGSAPLLRYLVERRERSRRALSSAATGLAAIVAAFSEPAESPG